MVDAVLGCEVEIQTIDGSMKIKIPPGTSHGHRIKV